MATKLKIEGIYPSVCVSYTDETCAEIDYDAYREHIRFMLQHPIGGLVVGGHAGETECLTMEERLAVLKIAIEESDGKVPVFGGIVADSTREAIRQGQVQKDAGADGVLFCPPAIVGWDAETGDELLIAHVRQFDREVKIPYIMFGGPGDWAGYKQAPETFRRLPLETEYMVGWKIVARYAAVQDASFAACVEKLREAEKQTGRRVSALYAGDSMLVETLMAGGDGDLNGGENYRVADNTAIFDAFKRGDIEEAKRIQKQVEPLSDAVRGIPLKRSFTYFHYRYKIAAWLMGYIPRPNMRLPQVPPPRDEFQMIYDGLVASGKKPVRRPEEFRPEPWIGSSIGMAAE
jgi:4-hydroxy-tetrahydrodipicolinate synthase